MWSAKEHVAGNYDWVFYEYEPDNNYIRYGLFLDCAEKEPAIKRVNIAQSNKAITSMDIVMTGPLYEIFKQKILELQSYYSYKSLPYEKSNIPIMVVEFYNQEAPTATIECFSYAKETQVILRVLLRLIDKYQKLDASKGQLESTHLLASIHEKLGITPEKLSVHQLFMERILVSRLVEETIKSPFLISRFPLYFNRPLFISKVGNDNPDNSCALLELFIEDSPNFASLERNITKLTACSTKLHLQPKQRGLLQVFISPYDDEAPVLLRALIQFVINFQPHRNFLNQENRHKSVKLAAFNQLEISDQHISEEHRKIERNMWRRFIGEHQSEADALTSEMRALKI